MPYNAKEHEQEVLAFWERDNTFKKSVEERPADQPYVFYDGPPFATGLPHYGHMVSSVMKDVVPRYYTMKGHRVERVWGWDCHGLPIENIVEKELGTKSKKEIEEMGVEKFNELCRSKVLGYVSEWEKTIHRLGRWVDMKNAYRTMDLKYMESVWWVFKQLWEGGYVYKGHRSMHICPRCETTLSQQEVSEGYKDIKDLSVTSQFRVTSDAVKQKLSLDGELYLLAWTTTPWTLPGNLFIAVGKDIEYTVVRMDDVHYVVAKDLLMANFEGKEFQVVAQILGSDLEGESYEPLFPYFADTPKAFRVVLGDFVTTEDGTGMVHIASGYGQDDYEVGQREGVAVLQHVGMNGRFIDAVTDFAGMHVKPIDDPSNPSGQAHMSTDVEIVKWLAHNGKLFAKKKYEHSYPHCWRCDTPLLNYATDSWFVSVTKAKERALALAKEVNWSPGHVKEGRFGKWLEGARDWSISRQRFWASVIPVWESEDGDQICVGSVAELEELSGQTIDDLHKHVVDKITFEKDGKTYTRVPDVLDTWFDSGSMPYAQVHYPYENKEMFEGSFPAEFIAEGLDQTRAWFYYLHVLASAIMDKPAFKNVIVNGIVLAEDGKKMSKKLQNYPDPNTILEQYGADALRYYLVSSPVMQAENLNFAEEGVREVYNKVVNTLWNVVSFYSMFTPPAPTSSESTSPLKGGSDGDAHVLDRWIMARLQQLVQDVTKGLDEYKLNEAARPIMDFVLDLSQWYVRNSRDRLKHGSEEDKAAAYNTLRYVLTELSKVMGPFTPFVAEKVFQKVTGIESSVHLEEWPEAGEVNNAVLENMVVARKLVEMGHASRKEAKLPVRQPLAELGIKKYELSDQLAELIAAELNVKKVAVYEEVTGLAGSWVSKEDGDFAVAICTDLSDELKKEGLLRELVRAVNMMRKEQGLTRDNRVVIHYSTDDELLKSVFTEYAEQLKQAVLADAVEEGDGDMMQVGKRDVALSVLQVT